MPTKIMLIRHAEKPADDPPPHGVTGHGAHDKKALTVRGWTRAGALAVLFAPPDGKFQDDAFARPDVIYAMGMESDSASARPQQTVAPLVEKLGDAAKTNFYFERDREKDMIASVLDRDGVVLVCWEHDRLDDAARHIPLSPNNERNVPREWDGKRFDLVWVFDWDEKGNGFVFSEHLQGALAGDEVR
jgi:hypothetical protein